MIPSRKIQGMVIATYPFNEKHLMVNFLFKNGHKMAAVAFGGASGGKINKGNPYQLGNVFDLVLTGKSQLDDICKVAERKISWFHNHISSSYRKFVLLCFMTEVAKKIAPEQSYAEFFDEPAQSVSDSLYSTLANGIFYLENDADDFSGREYTHKLVYIAKLLCAMGQAPALQSCGMCERDFAENEGRQFDQASGHFICSHCMAGKSDLLLWRALQFILHRPYRVALQLEGNFREAYLSLWNFFLYQQGFAQTNFKSIGLS